MQYTDEEVEDLYREALDEQGDILIGTLAYAPSQVLEAVDPIAYRVGLSDFASFFPEE
jgi:hypothetical protein